MSDRVQPEHAERSSGLWQSLRAPLEALLVAFFIVTFFFTTVGISGDSMRPTLRSGERAFVPKYEVWLHRAGIGQFARGDIVYFRPPGEVKGQVEVLGFKISPFFIKRIVAVAGDRIRLEDGQVYLNGEPLEERYLDRRWLGSTTLPEQVIPARHVFVLGDNRGPYGSVDSRRFGPIPIRAIAGRAAAVIWPLAVKTPQGWRWNFQILKPEVFGALTP